MTSKRYVQTHALTDLLFYKISSVSKFDILNHSGLFLVQFATLDVLASARNSGKILISTLVTHANVFLFDENRSGQLSKILSKSFRFNFCVGFSGRFSYLKIICTSIKIQISWCNRASFLPIFLLLREKKVFSLTQ